MAMALSLGLYSCAKSNEDLLKDYKNVASELVEASQDGDLKKMEELAKKGEKIDKELNGRDLTDSEKEEKAEIEVEMMRSLTMF